MVGQAPLAFAFASFICENRRKYTLMQMEKEEKSEKLRFSEKIVKN